jgi:two-component system sensor histidine kinase/response regulator
VFWFTAKLKVPEQSAAPVNKANPEGRRVIVVDDNPSVRRVLLQMLRGFGLIADEARTGLEAVERCVDADKTGCGYDVALIDLMMAGIDGVETIKRLHAQLPRGPALIAVSGFMSGPLQKQAELAGARRVLQKPLQPSLLLETLTELLDEDGIDAPAVSGAVYRNKPQHLKDVSILVVEDNLLNQEVAAAFLENWGCKVSIAGDGAQALHLVQENGYDMVLMDMQMPLMDGLEATRAIRAVERLRSLPIAAMTANAMPIDRERCFEAGMNDHISKPIDPERLLAVIRQHLSLLPVGEQAGEKTPPQQLVIAIPGVDTRSGLTRVLNNTELYQSMLRRFVDHAGMFAAESASAVAIKDWPTLERLAHTLKSTAALIGAEAVSDAAGNLEAAAQSPVDSAVATELAGTTARLALASAAAIRPAVDAHLEGAIEVEPHGGGTAQLVEELREYLIHDDARALRLCREHGVALAAVLGSADELVHAVERFDFVKALAALDKRQTNLDDGSTVVRKQKAE